MRIVAIGDPQGPSEKFFDILERNRVLGDGRRIREDVLLISIGDHFDWGRPEERDHATKSGIEIFEWLLGQPPARAIIILGNHDLARVGELAGFDQATYEKARAEADLVYRSGAVDKASEQYFLEKYPSVPTAEMMARDFSAFHVQQRLLVADAIKSGRAVLSHAISKEMLFVHAAVTTDDLMNIGLSVTQIEDARLISAQISEFLAKRAAAWSGGALDLSPLHIPGEARSGEGRGITYQRPSHPERSSADLFVGPPRRRYDPRRLPLAITQVVGHIRDEKCRKLLGPWVEGEEAPPGALRSLSTDGFQVRYRAGIMERAQLIFIDGSMRDTPAEQYALFELESTALPS